MTRNISGFLLAVLALNVSFGCGGGGGGAPPADVQGRIVLVGTGQPLVGASVSIGGSSQVTDAGGQFVFHGISSKSLQIIVTATGVLTLTQALPTLTPNALNDLGDVFVVDNSANSCYCSEVAATVVRADTFAPVVGATVLLSGMVQVTGANGRFDFLNLPVGLGSSGGQVGLIRAKPADNLEDKAITIEFGAGKGLNDLGQIPMATNVSGTIPPPPTNIRGTVTLQGLNDFSGTTVTLINKANGLTAGSGVTGMDGKYGFYVVAGQYTLKADHAGFTSQSIDVTLTRPDQPVNQDIHLIP